MPKIWINLAFRTAGIPRPSPWNAAAWYEDTSRRWGTEDRELVIARLPSIVLSAAGCVAIFAIGTLFRDRRTAGADPAAFLLAINPLDSLHVTALMSEASCEAFLLGALALGLAAWKSLLSQGAITPNLVLLIAAGASTGLSVGRPSSTASAPLALTGWTCLALALPGTSCCQARALCRYRRRHPDCLGVFIALNPFMTSGTLADLYRHSFGRSPR